MEKIETVSVIIPVYNVEKYLARCLDSILSQTHRALDIICVNDGATDSSAEILAEYEAKDARVRVLTQENCGVSIARNNGLNNCNGEWVMFVDSDDWIPKDAVEGFLKVAHESGSSIVACERYVINSLQVPTPREFHWKILSPALKNIVGKRKMRSSVWNKLYKTSLLKDRRFIEGIYFEDWPFITELFGDIDAFAMIKEPMYVYCINSNSTSIIHSSFSIKKVESYLHGIAHVTDYFKNHPMRKYAMTRVAIAQKMLEKRMRKAGMLQKRWWKK